MYFTLTPLFQRRKSIFNMDNVKNISLLKSINVFNNHGAKNTIKRVRIKEMQKKMNIYTA